MKKLIAMILLLTSTLSGCGRVDPNAPTRPKLVVQITADYESETVRLHRLYTDDEKMRAVLDYLRGLEPYGTVSEEETAAAANQAWIELTYSDGTTKRYHQRSDQYLRCGDGRWQNIPGERGVELPLLLGLMESDGEI